jgi:hypothetical protein
VQVGGRSITSAVLLDKPLYAMFKTYSPRQENTIVEVLPAFAALMLPGRSLGTALDG